MTTSWYDPVTIRIRRIHPDAALPVRATTGSTGLDVRAHTGPEGITIGPDPVLVPTGIAIEAEEGLDVQIRPRSGLSLRGVMVVFGTIDADYRGELLVSMYTTGTREPHTVHHGDRIAQLVISRHVPVHLIEVTELSVTDRGQGGHGSTGAR